MRIKTLPLLAALCLVIATAASHAQTVAVHPALCSPGSTSATVCADVPLSPANEDPAGFYIRDTNVAPSGHWISFYNASFWTSALGVAQIDSHTPTMDSVTYTYGAKTATGYLETSAVITFHGTDTSGDSYTGTAALTYTWTYSWTCSGRGCGGTLGWHRHISGGSLTISR